MSRYTHPLAHGLSAVRYGEADVFQGGRCGRERPAEEGGGGPERAGAWEALPPANGISQEFTGDWNTMGRLEG